jgi:Holliday junction resolvase RusA-like endonuclease
MKENWEHKIILPLPPSVNHAYIRTKFGMALSATAKKWKINANKSAKEQLDKWEIAYEKVVLDITVYWANNRRRDLDNCLKLTLDSLTGVVYVDDKFAIPRFQDYSVDKGNPRIEIVIRRHVDVCLKSES